MSKSRKKQKVLATFEVDKLDNTANIKKIVENLQHKNSNAFKLCTKVLGKRYKNVKGEHWHLVGHPTSAFPEDWDGDLAPDYFEEFHYRSTNPKIITNMKNINSCDPLTDYMRVKKDWMHKMQIYLGKSESFVKKYEKLNEEVAYCPKHFVNIAEHYYRDPDPYFESPYNWYYTGHGNLQLISINFIDYLAHSEFTKFYISEFSQEQVEIIAEKVFFDCGKGNNILETLCYTNNIVVLRTMYKIFILKIIMDEDISIEKLKDIESKIAYTSIASDSYHKNILYVSKLDSNLSIINLDTMTYRKVQLPKPKSLIDNWNSTVSIDRNYYCHISSDIATIYDKRTNTATSKWDFKGVAEWTCHKLTAARRYDECLYLGTNHHLLTVDLRNCTSYKPKPLQRWTHNMLSSPTYFSQACFETNKDLICLSSQWCEDMCLIVSDSRNILDREFATGVTLPYRPPNILTTLKEARFKMLCNDLYNPLDSRLCTSITGVLLLEINDKYSVLMQNSLGDITNHTIYPDYLDIFINKDSEESLSEWSKKYVLGSEVFEVSDVVNIGHILKSLKKVPEDSKYFDEEIVNDNFSKNEILETFRTDELDSGLLDAWSISGFEENNAKEAISLSISMEE